MKKELKKDLTKEMKDVIAAARKVREYVSDENTSLEEKRQNLAILTKVIEANKNIITASVVIVNVNKLSDGE